MFLQFLMIIIIVGRFYDEYTQEDKAVQNSWQLWYMMIFTYLMPLIGMLMFFFVHQFWTSKLPVDVIWNLVSELQTEGKEGNVSKNKTDTMVEQVMNHLGIDQFRDDCTKLKNMKFFEKLIYPCISPHRVIVSSLYIGAFAVFFVSSIYNGPSDWLGFHIAVAIIAYCINIYAASIAVYCSLLLIILASILFDLCYGLFIIVILALVLENYNFLFALLYIPLFIIIALIVYCCLRNSRIGRNPRSPCYCI